MEIREGRTGRGGAGGGVGSGSKGEKIMANKRKKKMSQSLTSTQNKGRNAVEGEDDTVSNATTALSGLLQRWKKVFGR